MALTGRCLCGDVRFEVDASPEEIWFCHCESCKKLSGAGGTANFRAPSSSIRIVSGTELVETYQPPEGSAKTFCRACGSNLFGGGWPDSELCSVRVPGLEDQPDGLPGGHLYVRSVAPWETLPEDGLERFETGRAG
jgi:ADP-ribosyl-[dinitrogen reductase] hydrolase